VPRIVPALKANDNIGAAGEPIDDLAFPFITPLRPDNDDIGHSNFSHKSGAKRYRSAP